MLKDASYWAEQVKNKEVSPLELLDATLEKYKSDDLNAIVEYDYELAKECLNEWEYQGRLFDGVPIPLKCLGQDYKGMSATGASKLLAGNKAQITDNFVQTVLQAGFIPFGKTNSPEFGFKNITDSELYGDCLNAWDKSRYSGGSSGGAASAVASGLAPLAGASDGGGSIRIPASWSGLIGLKPTRGRTAKGPGGYRGWQGASIDFAETISVRDTARFLAATQVLQEENPYPAPLLDEKGLLNLTSPQKRLKIAYSIGSPVGTKISEEAQDAVLQTVKYLEELGHYVEQVDYPVNGRALIEDYYLMNASETFAMFEAGGASSQIIKEYTELMTYTLYEFGRNVPVSDYINSLNTWEKANHEFNIKIFNNFDLFLTPTTATVAPKTTMERESSETRQKMENITEFDFTEQKKIVSDMFERSLELSPYPFVVNLTGQAAISLPTYVSPDGLPLGVQFMGPKNSEILLLSIAKELEDAGKFILPDYYKK